MSQKATPTPLKILTGNPGHKPINKNEPKPLAAEPTCPAHLKGEARREWKRLIPELMTLGLMSRIDRGAFAGYCQCWARWVEAEKALAEGGLVVRKYLPRPSKRPVGRPRKDEVEPAAAQPEPEPLFNLVVSPYVRIVNETLQQMRLYLVEFGLTPSSRAGLSVDSGKPGKVESRDRRTGG